MPRTRCAFGRGMLAGEPLSNVATGVALQWCESSGRDEGHERIDQDEERGKRDQEAAKGFSRHGPTAFGPRFSASRTERDGMGNLSMACWAADLSHDRLL